MPADHLILFDGPEHQHLLPLAATRAIADFRVGILRVREKWERALGIPAEVLTRGYLQPKYPYSQKQNSVFVNASILPDAHLLVAIDRLEEHSALKDKDTFIAIKTNEPVGSPEALLSLKGLKEVNVRSDIQLTHPWSIFLLNGQEIRNDIRLLGLEPNPEALSATNRVFGREQVYVEEGVTCECSVINAKAGPVFLGKGSEVMEGCTIRGPFALGKHSTLKMQSKVYGDTSIGPHCKVGGEISNSVIFGYSNKAHDGFLGNSVLGEWCNLGADTNNSNLKNNYGNVKAWDYAAKSFVHTDLQFCGLIMGDHAKCGINTMFNTGTVAGVGANIFGGGYPPRFIPDFSWGGSGGFEEYALNKSFEVAQRVMERRGVELTETDKQILTHVFESTREFRK